MNNILQMAQFQSAHLCWNDWFVHVSEYQYKKVKLLHEIKCL